MFAHKLVISFWLLVISLFITPLSALAQTSPLPANLQIPSYISPTSPLYTDMLLHNMFHSFSCLSVGSSVIGQPCLTYQLQKNAQGVIQGVPILSSVNLSGGTLGATTSLIGALFDNRPVRTADYLASVGKGLGIEKEANAQVTGSGAKVLSPILTLWQVSRNISYLIMIIIFIVIGMMIMFRNKINPQTVITAQAALPGLVIGLIMITFSYFLAGLISDMAFVGTNVVGYYFQVAQNKQPGDFVQKISSQNVVSIFSPFTGIINRDNAKEALDTFWNHLGSWPQTILSLLGVFFTAQFASQSTDALKAIPIYGAGIQAAIVGVASAAAAAAPTTVIGMTLGFIAGVALLYSMLRLLLRLLNSFLSIIFLTIMAPFQFLAASLPGRQGMATEWILSMIGNALIFPAVLAVFYFVAIILGPAYTKECAPNNCAFEVSGLNKTNHTALIPTAYAEEIKIVGNQAFPLFGGLNLQFIELLLAFGALLALPAIPDIIVRAVAKASQAGQLIGQEIGSGVASGQRYAGQFQSGVGSASQQLGQGRALSGTSAYIPAEVDAHGNPTKWAINPHAYQPSFGQKLQARAAMKAGQGVPVTVRKGP